MATFDMALKSVKTEVFHQVQSIVRRAMNVKKWIMWDDKSKNI